MAIGRTIEHVSPAIKSQTFDTENLEIEKLAIPTDLIKARNYGKCLGTISSSSFIPLATVKEKNKISQGIKVSKAVVINDKEGRNGGRAKNRHGGECFSIGCSLSLVFCIPAHRQAGRQTQANSAF